MIYLNKTYVDRWLLIKLQTILTVHTVSTCCVHALGTFSLTEHHSSINFAPVRCAMRLPAGGLLGVVQHTVQHTSASSRVPHGRIQLFSALKCAGNVQYTLNFLGATENVSAPYTSCFTKYNIQEISRKLAKYSWTSKSHHVRILHNISFSLMSPQSVPRKVHAAQSPHPVARLRCEAQPSKTDPC